MPTPIVNTPLTAAIVAIVTQIVALIVGFGIIDNQLAGEILALTVAAINVGALIYAAVVNHSKALVHAAKITAGQPVAPPVK